MPHLPRVKIVDHSTENTRLYYLEADKEVISIKQSRAQALSFAEGWNRMREMVQDILM